MRALISVSDKTGVVAFAKQLHELGWELLSTGGTAKALEEANIPVTEVSQITGFPECFDGRVKTLHPMVHGGLLNIRENEEHQRQKKELGVEDIDLVCINLYPFKKTVESGADFETCIENIDIGGPTMLRSAAKNFKYVTVLTDPADYETVLHELREDGQTSYETRYELALKVFELTAAYDARIAQYLKRESDREFTRDTLTLTFEKVQDMRYGENPHQKAAFYKTDEVKGTLADALQLQGKELSYNNINDTNGALEILKEYQDEPTIVAVKHANPCGIASSDTIYKAYVKAYEADPTSIFGGIVASNGTIDKDTAEEMVKIFLEVIVAPDFTDEALQILAQKPNLRVLKLENILDNPDGYEYKAVRGGLLVQSRDNKDYEKLEVVTDRAPTEKEMEDLLFAWKAVKNTKSNAISLAKDKVLIANGPGQVNRVWPTEYCIMRGGDAVKGSVLASDAFFPFSDCAEAAAKAGITAIIQPGGSVRDQDSIDVCNQAGIAMVFTGMRHFKHS